MANPPLIGNRQATVVPLDEAPGPLGGITDPNVRKEIEKIWTTFQNRVGYDGTRADHTFVTQADLRALHLTVQQRIDGLPPPKTYDDLVGAVAKNYRLTVQDEGINVGTNVKVLNFVGAAVTASDSGNGPVATINVTGGGGSGSGVLKGQEFTANGTFTVPDGVTSLWITMIGAGSGGSSSILAATGGGGGGGGETVISLPIIAVSGASYAVVIGVGGLGALAGQVTAQFGGVGGDTSFGGLWFARGGKVQPNASNGSSGAGGGFGGNPSKVAATAGALGSIEASTHFGGSSGGGGSSSTVQPGQPGGGAASNNGGLAGAAFSTQAGGGGGASSLYGIGGTGGAGGSPGLAPVAGAYGAGGGGGGGKAAATSGGGAGMSGYCLVQWIS